MGIVTRLNPLGGALKFYFFKINPTPSTAKILINNVETDYVVGKSGTVFSWRVSSSGYSAQEGVICLSENIILNVELVETEYQKLTITPHPNDSIVTINGEVQNEIIVEFGTAITWSVQREGYTTKTGSIQELIDDIVLDVDLEKEKYLFEINTIPSNAEVYINNILQSSALIPYNEVASWRVKKYGYATKSGSQIITENTSIDVELVEVPFYNFEIVTNPASAIIVINSENINPVSLEENSVIEWSVSKQGYIEQKGILNLIKDTALNITLEKMKFIFQILSVLPDCIIRINNCEYSSLIVEFEDAVTWIVEKQGYISKSGELVITEDTTLNIELEKENYTYTIIPEPSDSIVYINGIEQTSINVPYETNVSYSVSRAGHEAQTGIFCVLENFTHFITLEKKTYTFEISSNVESALIYVNGEPYSSLITLEYGTTINWSVSANGYTSQSDTFILTENTKLNIVLIKKIFKVVINPVPSDSTIFINGVETNFIEAPFLTEFQYSVSHEGYVTKTGSYTIINDWNLPIELEVLQYTLNVNPTPSNAIVTLNGVQQNSITVNYGTNVNWSVSATGYETKSGTHKVVQDDTLNILLSLAYYTVTFNPTPADAIVKINNIEQKAITAIYNSTFNWNVSAQYYISQSGSEKVEKTYTKNIVLKDNAIVVPLDDFNIYGGSNSTKNGSTTTWTFGSMNSKTSTSSIMATCIWNQGIVSGPCKIKMSYEYGTWGPRPSEWSFSVLYYIKTGNITKNTTVEGQSAIVILNEGDTLTRFSMSYGGVYKTFSGTYTPSCTFSLVKYV